MGIRGLSRDQVWRRAHGAHRGSEGGKGVLVRNHGADVGGKSIAQPALQATIEDFSIVLTPSYAAQLYNL